MKYNDHDDPLKALEQSARRMSLDAGSVSQATVREIGRRIAADMRPVRPVAPSHHFFAAFAAILVLMVAIGVYRIGAFALAVLSRWQAGAILGALAGCAGLLAFSLTQQMVPGSRHRIHPNRLPVFIVSSLILVMAISLQPQHENALWTRNWFCLKSGAVLALAAAVPFGLLLRRGAVLSPRSTGATTGLLAGLAGTGMLEIHCPNLDLWHILVAHLGVAVFGATAGFVTGLAIEALSEHSRQAKISSSGHLSS